MNAKSLGDKFYVLYVLKAPFANNNVIRSNTSNLFSHLSSKTVVIYLAMTAVDSFLKEKDE